jgi:hypothetical protein
MAPHAFLEDSRNAAFLGATGVDRDQEERAQHLQQHLLNLCVSTRTSSISPANGADKRI